MEKINHAIQHGCIQWVDPLLLAKPTSRSVLDYVSPFPKNISPDEWIPEIEDEVDDSPPLLDDLESDSDSEESDSRIQATLFTDIQFP